MKLKVPANEWVFRNEPIDGLPMALRERLPSDILAKKAHCIDNWFDVCWSADELHACGIKVLVSEDDVGSDKTKQQFQVLDNKVLEIVEWYRVQQGNAHHGLWHVTDSRQLMTWEEIRKTGERVLPNR